MAKDEGRTEVPPGARRQSPWTFSGLLEVGTVFVCGAVVASSLSGVWWIFELATHFRPHLAILLASLSVWWFTRRSWKLALACVLLALISFVPVYSALKTPHAREVVELPRLRIASINVHTANQRSDFVLEFIRESAADMVMLMESISVVIHVRTVS